MESGPRPEHRWLEQLIGKWTCESECIMGADQPPMQSQGDDVVTSLGGLWTIAEMTATGPDGSAFKSIMTLGYDDRTQKFVGTFIASMMTYLWQYRGQLDSSGKVLTLDTEGPSFTGEGLSKYQDVIEIVSPDERTLRSRQLGADGQWHHFMFARYRRVA